MITSQRLIIMLIICNIMIGLSLEIYSNPHELDMSGINGDITTLETVESQFNEEGTIYGNIDNPSSQTTQENTIGNTIKMGWIILKVLIKGISPIPITRDGWANAIESTISTGLILFRSLIYVITALEIYFIYKNKKNT